MFWLTSSSFSRLGIGGRQSQGNVALPLGVFCMDLVNHLIWAAFSILAFGGGIWLGHFWGALKEARGCPMHVASAKFLLHDEEDS